MINYIVILHGHIALFEQWEPARGFARDFNGAVYNLWGLQQLQKFRSKYPETAALWNREGDMFRTTEALRTDPEAAP